MLNNDVQTSFLIILKTYLYTEIVVTPSLKLIVIFSVVLITSLFQSLMEVLCIILVKVVGGQITAAAKPPSS